MMRRTQLSLRKVRTSYFVLRTSYLSHRRGISLLEVLISMFVLLVGLMSVASLIPVGRFEMGEGLKIDRSSTLGLAAFREIKIRGILQPDRLDAGVLVPMWPTIKCFTNTADSDAYVRIANAASSFAIDPWFMAQNSTVPAIDTFPYTPLAGAPLMRRITLSNPQNPPTAEPPPLSAAVADRIVRSDDELTFNRTSTLPAQQYSTGNNKRQSEGNYSWLITIVPHTFNWQRIFTVSTVIFYRRVGSAQTGGGLPPPERMVEATYQGVGQFELSAGTNPATYLTVKPGQWVMVGGQKMIPPGELENTSASNLQMNVFRWYRIVAADDIQTGSPATRSITVAGADWDPSLTGVSASIFDDAIAVYERQMKLEAP